MRETIEAVLSNDVRALFESLGLLEQFEAEAIKCHICGDTITENNFTAVTRYQGELKFSCEKPGCLAALAALGR